MAQRRRPAAPRPAGFTAGSSSEEHPGLSSAAGQLFINIRKLAALDLVFHGPRFILIEFGGAVLLTVGLAALSMRSAFSSPGHPVIWEIVLGVLLASIGANYVPLLVNAIALVRSGTAREEVAGELEQARQSQRRYGIQQFLLVVPFAVMALAVAQALERRPPRRKQGM